MLQMITFILEIFYCNDILPAVVRTTRQILQMIIFILQIFYCTNIFPTVVLTTRQMLQILSNINLANLLLYWYLSGICSDDEASRVGSPSHGQQGKKSKKKHEKKKKQLWTLFGFSLDLCEFLSNSPWVKIVMVTALKNLRHALTIS